MLFSILVAHYNNFEYFKDFYKSVLNQTYQNFEIIIVDDCSTDDSLQKIKSLTENNKAVKIYKNEINKGVGFTKRKCVELAKGEICGFIDPDDAVVSDALELSIQKYVDHPNIVATYSQIMLCDNLLTPQKIYSRTKRIKNGDQYFFNINNEVSHFFTFRRDFYFKTDGINEELIASEDFDLYLKLYEKGKFEFINSPLYYYRQHSSGVSQNKHRKKTVIESWNKVLFDTCVRRNIHQFGNIKASTDINLAKVLFERENTFRKKLNRYIRKKF
ncbi:glycosyltransferase family 2 protein [Kaistella carnis]|uniref:Glycosyltransferase family 2 protein n=1 Tax=Kaistella carnis TaxID=1241979 RepID=A0A3G8XJQ4_9FLAO|nr:glycosyltransferase family A protein [Kaistella carnis]AZI33339.1 glycosyltransferase family 2 protein [Kaistella carnis]